MRRADCPQLPFAFAANPQGRGDDRPDPVVAGRAHLRRIANGKERDRPAAGEVDASRLLEEVASPANLARALQNVARNKGAPGVDRQTVEAAVADAARLLPRLSRQLLEGRYRPGEVRRVWIPKPGGGRRGLGIPNVVDRVVQQAVLQVLEPIFEPTFHPSSHGFRPGRGAPTAIAEARRHLSEGYTVVVDIDIARFFDRVNHQRLLARLARKVDDPRVLRLIGRMLKAKTVLPDGARVTADEGTPQGGPLSPLLSNVVLDEMDQELSRRGLRFVRYADDCNIFVRSERAGRRVMGSVRGFLERRLRLQVNDDKSAVRTPDRLHFLGFRFTVEADGRVEVHLSARTCERLKARIRELTPCNWGGSLGACMAGLNRYLRGWLAYFRLCTEAGAEAFKGFDAHIRRRLRAIIIRQKKRPRYLYRHLRRRGVSRRAAWNAAYCGRGPWHRSNRPGLVLAYPVRWFTERVFTLEDQWQTLHPQSTGPAQLQLL